MSTQITTAMVDTYRTGIEMLAQQKKCVLEPFVRTESDTGERVSFDQIGLVAAKKKTIRHADTQRVNTPHKRRWVFHDDYEISDLLDIQDMIKVLNQPGDAYAQAFVAGLNRAKDAAIVTAALGTAYTGKTGTGTTSLPAGNQIAAGGTGFTLAKLRTAATLLFGKAVFNGDEELHVGWTRAQEDAFMNETEVKSFDYNTQRVLVKGTISGTGDMFLGFNFHRLEDWEDEEANTNRILPKVSTTRTCLAWVKDGILLNVPMQPQFMVDRMPGKGQSWQYWAGASFGATRMQETKVVQIDVVEA